MTRVRWMIAAALGAAFLSAPIAAVAQGAPCAPRDVVLETLKKKYGERPVALGVTLSGALVEVLASEAGKWTIIVTAPGGPTCMVASGEGWRQIPAEADDAV